MVLRDHGVFVSLDDKHRIKVGEPGFPVAFEVGDHDFTRMSIVPSVCFVIDIPESVESSWYTGKVFVGLKEAIFEPSSPPRHIAELYDVLTTQDLQMKPVMFMYTDGGPDHRLTYLSVQMSLISLFLKLDLYFLCACRTAPFHSWRNPVERIMSILNLGFQSIGLMRKQVEDRLESTISKCNNMKQLRAAAQKEPELVDAVLDSMSPVKIVITDVIRRLCLKGKHFEVYSAASMQAIEEIWDNLHSIDTSLKFGDKYQKGSLSSHPSLKDFLDHCCQQRHYSFCIKKCGEADCAICKPPRLPPEIFSQIHHLPDPTPASDGHYKQFSDVYGKATTEAHRPSIAKRTGRNKSLPFVASVQHVRNVTLMIQCEECGMWRLLYSLRKLSSTARQNLVTILDDFTFTCGATVSDLELSDSLSDVCVRDVQCYDPLEKLYYSMNYEPICIHCCSEDNLVSVQGCYPQCENCKHKEPVKKSLKLLFYFVQLCPCLCNCISTVLLCVYLLLF